MPSYGVIPCLETTLAMSTNYLTCDHTNQALDFGSRNGLDLLATYFQLVLMDINWPLTVLNPLYNKKLNKDAPVLKIPSSTDNTIIILHLCYSQ